MSKVGTAVLEIKPVLNEEALASVVAQISTAVTASLELSPVRGAEYESGDLAVNVEWYDSGSNATYSGFIEDRARTWIIYLDAHGQPALYWPHRAPSGAVIGEQINL